MSEHRRFLAHISPISQSVQAYARHLAWNKNDVQDIFQTALMNALKKFDSYTEGTNFKAWFLKFVTFAAFNMNRKHAKISSREVIMEAEYISNMSSEEINTFNDESEYEHFLKDPDSILDNIKDEIKDAVRNLPDKRRSIFLLRSIAELSYQEISQILDVPVGTVMGELFRARKQLRVELKGIALENGVLKRMGEEDEM